MIKGKKYGKRMTNEQRFFSYVNVGEIGCWEWLASKIRGYGQFGVTRDGNQRMIRAHRYSYELANGPIPHGMCLDHLCRNRGCVNPAHLEVVTVKENLLRGDTFAAKNSRKRMCVRGHEFTHRRNGQRVCKKCVNINQRKRRAKESQNATKN